MSSEDSEEQIDADGADGSQPATGDVNDSESEIGRLSKHRPILTESETRDLKYSFALLGVAAVIFIGLGFYHAGPVFAITEAVIGLGRALVGTAIAIVACMIIGELLGTSFGTLTESVVKLAAATIFPTAIALVVALFLPWLGWVFFFVLSLSLLMTMFDLELYELIALVIAQAVVVASAANWNALFQST